MRVAVRKNHPIDPVVSAGQAKYPFDDMVDGDSFSMPIAGFATSLLPKPTFETVRERIRSAGSMWRRRTGSNLYFLFGVDKSGENIEVQAYIKQPTRRRKG